MRIRVIYFGMLKDVIGRQMDTVELKDGATLAELFAECMALAPKVKDFQDAIALSVNAEFAQMSKVLFDGDEVAVLPPVSGGTQSAASAAGGGCATRCAIVREPLQQQQIMDEIKQSEDGAVSIFDGIVRDNTRGRKTLYLEYEAYEEMALRQMEKLAADAIADFKVRDVRIVHRLGRLEIGETSVFIVVASAHRAAAMDASRWLIDTLKKTVPIWKKEYFAGGAIWADGEPFPEDVRPTVQTNNRQ